jgi:hypothetical protein
VLLLHFCQNRSLLLRSSTVLKLLLEIRYSSTICFAKNINIQIIKFTMQLISIIIFLCFFPACIGILNQAIWGTELTNQIIAIAMCLFCIEQARMAVKDLQKITEAQKILTDIRLDYFCFITVTTIIVELLGFYTSTLWLGWGSIIILLSQIWFNLLAAIKIQSLSQTSTKNPIEIIKPWTISERLPVLIADILGLVLVSFWILKFASFWISLILCTMVVIYLGIKLISTVYIYLNNRVFFS